jgi:hypothetical protein
MRTPIQELIEVYQQMREDGDNDMRTVILWAREKLEKEKEVMCGIYDDAIARIDNDYTGGEGEQYYNETFNTK